MISEPFAGIDLQSITEDYETPFYLYDIRFVLERAHHIKENLSSDIKLYYSVKANPNGKILAKLSEFVDGADISSGGELVKAIQAGYNPDKLSFAGPGKTDYELGQAIAAQIGSISVESINEFLRINKIAQRMNKKANVSLRINPSRMFKEFAIKMGGKSSQFGIDEERYLDFFETLSQCSNCQFVGIHIYSGTQCLKPEVLIDNFCNTMDVVQKVVKETKTVPNIINFGGGFGVPYYENQTAFDVKKVCSLFSEKFANFKIQNKLPELIGLIELGRYLVAEAGIYVTRIIDIKESRGEKYCVMDGGMHHNLPASGNFGQIIRKNFKIANISDSNGTVETVTVVGPLCTSIDILGKNISIPKPKIGDYLAVLNSGAYAYTASPLLFLSHKLPDELMIDENNEVKPVGESFPSS